MNQHQFSTMGLGLLQLLGQQPGTTNLVISPLTVGMALTLAWDAAAGQTRQELAQVLGFAADADDQQIRIAINQLIESFAEFRMTAPESLPEWRREQQSVVQLASALFANSQIDPTYVARCQQMYASYAQSVRFNPPEPAEAIINHWVAQQTNQRITQLVSGLSEDTLAVLVSALWLKALWRVEFDQYATAPHPFTTADQRSVMVQMMHKTHDGFGYARFDQVQLIRLPCVDNRLGLDIVLPDVGSSLSHVLKQLSGADLQRWLTAIAPANLKLALPKFKLSSNLGLKSALQALGVQQAFDQRARFTAAFGDERVVVSDVMHQCILEVHERGIEAAAAAAVVMVGLSMPFEEQPPIEVTVDRPFLVLIRDTTSNMLLFLAMVGDPS